METAALEWYAQCAANHEQQNQGAKPLQKRVTTYMNDHTNFKKEALAYWRLYLAHHDKQRNESTGESAGPIRCDRSTSGG